jgi:hypothetical protein
MTVSHLAKAHFDSGNLDVVTDSIIVSFRGITVRIGDGGFEDGVGVQIFDHKTGELVEYSDGVTTINGALGDTTAKCRRALEFAIEKWRKP